MGLKPERKQTCFLIDFGLARRYMLPNGDIRPPRDMAGFRGFKFILFFYFILFIYLFICIFIYS